MPLSPPPDSNVHLTLLIPQLVWPEPEDRIALEKLPCPGLERLLARGTLSQSPVEIYEQTLAALFGLAPKTPFGPLRLLGETTAQPGRDAREGIWLCADPVHLRFHQERIILADAGAFDLHLDESLALAAGLNEMFADLGQFHVADARRWYVQLRTPPSDFFPPPLSAVAGRRIDGNLSGDAQASRLRTWLNEMQMFLHGHPVNARRMEAGQPAVNSLWLWGAGSLPPESDLDYAAIWASAPLAVGLARATGIATHPRPSQLGDLLAQAGPEERHLVVLDSLLPPVLYDDSRAWREALQDLEHHWFSPLATVLGRKVKTLTLIAPTVYGELTWEWQALDRWKFWRHPQALAALARSLAQ